MKLNRRRLGVASLGIVLSIAAVIGSLVISANSASAVTTANQYIVDADASTAAIDATVTVPVGNTFDIAWVVDNIVDPWQAEQGNMTFDPAVVSFSAGSVTDTNLGSAILCGGTSSSSHVYWGCARLSGTTTAAGVVRTMTFTCIADGISPLHLRSNADVGVATGTNFAIAGGTADPVLIDAQVVCGTGAAPTPTNTTVPPTATNTTVPGSATATNTTVPGTATSTTIPPAPTRTNTPEPTDTPEPGATEPPAATATTAPGGPVATATPPGGGPGGVVSGPNTGTGDGLTDGASGLLLWLAIAIGLVGLSAVGAAGYKRYRGSHS